MSISLSFWAQILFHTLKFVVIFIVFVFMLLILMLPDPSTVGMCPCDCSVPLSGAVLSQTPVLCAILALPAQSTTFYKDIEFYQLFCFPWPCWSLETDRQHGLRHTVCVCPDPDDLEHVLVQAHVVCYSSWAEILSRSPFITDICKVQESKWFTWMQRDYLWFLLQHKLISLDKIGIWECFRCIADNWNRSNPGIAVLLWHKSN